jgi:sugar lactone lactonase YvrE
VFSGSQASAQAQLPGNIYTVAGGGLANNVSAQLVALGQSPGVALDGQGNVYIAASDVRRVYKVDASGTATVFAGTGVPGSSGDGGPATMAEFIDPQGIALDNAGNVYIVDLLGVRVRKVDTSGIITTFAGTGTQGFSGDNGPASKAQLGGPDAVAVDGAGNVYIAEFVNHRVRKVDPTGTITTFAGNGTQGFAGDNGPATGAQLNFPFGLAVDSSSNVYIGDADNNRVRKVDATGKITTFAGGGTMGLGDGGPATSARLSTPQGLAFDAAGNLYIAETTGARVRKVDTSGTITTVAGNGGLGFSGDSGAAVQAELGEALSVAVVRTGSLAGTLYIAEGVNFDVRKVDTNGIITSFAGNRFAFGTGDGGPATSAQLGFTEGVAVDSLGNLFITDSSDNAIRKVDTSGVIHTIAGNGQFSFSGDGGPASLATLDLPFGLGLDSAGNLFFADNFRVRKIDRSGVINTVAGNGTLGFSGDNGPATQAQIEAFAVAIDSAGNFYIADTNNQRIRKVDTAGIITTVAGNGTAGFGGDNGPAVNAQLHQPISVAVDSAGNLFVADQENLRVRKIDTSGIITTVAGTGNRGFTGDNGPATAANLDGPDAVALDRSGNLFLNVRGRIRKVDQSGIITTVAGNGTVGFSGDGGPALNAGISVSFAGITLDNAGNLFISDESQRIRKVVNASGFTLFSISPGVSSLTVSPGGTATATLTIAPANGFSGSVSLACAVTVNTPGSGNAPTCSVNPAQVNVGPGSPSATLTVSAGPHAGLVRPPLLHGGGRFTAWGMLAVAVVLGAGASRRKRGRNSRFLSLLFLACVLAGVGCGGSGGGPNVGPPATFKVTTTASSGSASASTSISVSVQ